MIDVGLDAEQLLLVASAFSVVAVIATLIGVPWVVARLPHDYFSRPRRDSWRRSASAPPLALLLGLFKNVLGALLVLLGLLMLVTPGQGLLTFLAGLLLMNFPGKYQLERWLVMRPGVLKALNWLRARQRQVPFDQPPPRP